jgi:cytochrome P450
MEPGALIRRLPGAVVRRTLPDSTVSRARELRSTLRERAAERGSPLLFAFPGGAGSWDGMGRQLYYAEPVFRDSVDSCSQVAEDRLGFAAARALLGDDSVEVEPSFQLVWRHKTVLLGIVQIALWDLWQAAGVSADGILGVSLGGITGAYATGALTREETMAVVCSIAHRASEHPTPSEMISVSADIDTAKGLAHAAPAPLEFLGEVGPQTAILISAVEDAQTNGEFIAASGRRLSQSRTNWTHHTMLQPFDRQAIANDLEGIAPGPIRLPFYMSATGGQLAEDAVLDGFHFWWALGSPFYYGSALAAALRDGFRVIVSVGADAVLNRTIHQTAGTHGARVRVIDSMRADRPELATWQRARRQMRGRASQDKRRRRLRPIANETVDGLVRRPLLVDPDFERDPNVYLARLRDAAAVHYLSRHRCWLVVGYDAVRSVLMNPHDYSHRDIAQLESTLLGADGEEHLIARRMVARMFSADAIRSFGAYAEATSDQLLAPLIGKPGFDVVREFATPLTALVAGRLLELDDASSSELRAHVTGPPRPTGVQMARARVVIEPLARRIPLYSQLVGEHGYRHDAAVGLITLLWVAATSTTRSAIGSSVLRLADSSVRRPVQAQPDLLPGLIEETLRLDTDEPLITRTTVREVTLADVDIPANSSVMLTLGAANRDPVHFQEPDRLILDRPNTRDHLTFAAGPHRCLGARLARVEIRAALMTLLRLMPDFELAQPPHTVRYARAGVARTLEQLTVTGG